MMSRGTPCMAAATFAHSSLNTLIQMVVGSLGITLLPALSLAMETQRIRHLSLRPFQQPGPGRTIGLVWGNDVAPVRRVPLAR